MKRSQRVLALLTAVLIMGACDDDDDGMGPTTETTTFEVTVANVSPSYGLLGSGVFNTPVDADEPGPLTPGGSYEAVFAAAPGHRLHFATMFVQSNDFFYAPDEEGIALYTQAGNKVEGDVTDQVLLWDAGTEVNQEPGLGEDQAPNQSGPDTGADDPTDEVRIAPDDFDNLPAVDEVVRVTLTSMEGSYFRLTVENVSDGMTLTTSDGGSGPVVLAPGVFAVGSAEGALFTTGQPDRGEGLEALAEDGNPAPLAESLAAETGLTSPLAPGAYAVHRGTNVVFTTGRPDRGQGLEGLAEDGTPGTLAASLTERDDVASAGVFNTPAGSGSPGPLLPGSSYTFTFEARPGNRLSFATMLVQTNDLFYSPDDDGIDLFPAGAALSGDITDMIQLWDAGTEVNQHPGAGLDQAPRQAGPDTGPDEDGTVSLVDDDFSYPAVEEVVRVTITPVG